MKLYIGHWRRVVVSDTVPAQQAKGGAHKIIDVRWVGWKKVDGTQRSRLVAKGIMTHNVQEVFVLAPAVESRK